MELITGVVNFVLFAWLIMIARDFITELRTNTAQTRAEVAEVKRLLLANCETVQALAKVQTQQLRLAIRQREQMTLDEAFSDEEDT